MRSALDVHRALLEQNVPHEVVRLPSRVLSADDLPRVLGLSAGCVTVRCYVLTRPAGASFAAVAVPAGSVPAHGLLRAALRAAALRAATPADVNEATEYAAGLVSPVCLPPAVELIADTALGRSDVVYTAVGEGGLALGIRTRDLLVVTGARVAALTGPALRVDDAPGVSAVDLTAPAVRHNAD